MTSTAVDRDDDYAIYQTSTISALLAGVYDGDLTIAELLRHGDFGLGTFNHLDGEMVVVDGVCYHLRSDGSVRIADDSEMTPFAAVTHFRPQSSIELAGARSMLEVTDAVDALIGSDNVPVAVRVDGLFAAMSTRTVGAQTPPYPPLVEATAHEAVNFLTATTGTIAGFRTPRFQAAQSVAGYHLHYVDAARTHGGHVLDFAAARCRVSISTITQFHLSLPASAEYRRADLNPADLDAQVRLAEGGGR